MECGAPEEVLSVKVSLDKYYYRRAGSLLTFYLCLMLCVLYCKYVICVELIYAMMMNEVMEFVRTK